MAISAHDKLTAVTPAEEAALLSTAEKTGGQSVRAMKPDDLIKLQKLLNRTGAEPPLVIDGTVGPTEAALRKFELAPADVKAVNLPLLQRHPVGEYFESYWRPVGAYLTSYEAFSTLDREVGPSKNMAAAFKKKLKAMTPSEAERFKEDLKILDPDLLKKMVDEPPSKSPKKR